MRSRFSHDGQLDHHADNEHDLFRRAEEALERQRQQSHATQASEHTTVVAPLTNGLPSPSSAASAQPAIAVPKMPHEEIAERFALKPTTAAATRSHRGRR